MAWINVIKRKIKQFDKTSVSWITDAYPENRRALVSCSSDQSRPCLWVNGKLSISPVFIADRKVDFDFHETESVDEAKNEDSPVESEDVVSSFVNAKTAGDYGESLFQEELRRIKGSMINGYIATENMIIDSRNFEIDFLVLVPGIGLIVTEIKYYGGHITCSSEKKWKKIKSNGKIYFHKNASIQVNRAKSLLKKLLILKKINHWPVKSLVVFTHPEAEINQIIDKIPQTEVVTLQMFENWLNHQPKNSDIRFSRSDFKKIRLSLKSIEQKYEKGAHTNHV